MMNKCRTLPHLFGIVLAISLAAPASAATVDLTSAGAEGSINGARYFQFGLMGAGSGNIDAFVRYQAADKDITQGYNTDGNVQFDEVSGAFTHSLKLSTVPQILLDGSIYRQFAFDINEAGGNQSLLSLDQVAIYVAPVGDLGPPGNPYPFAAPAALVYDMDAGEDSFVRLNGDLSGPGSGSLDMLLYVPNSVFGVGDPYVYLYSRVGEQGGFYANSDGFEEWSVSTQGGIEGAPGEPIPEPSSLILSVLGLGLLAWPRRPNGSAID